MKPEHAKKVVWTRSTIGSDVKYDVERYDACPLEPNTAAFCGIHRTRRRERTASWSLWVVQCSGDGWAFTITDVVSLLDAKRVAREKAFEFATLVA